MNAWHSESEGTSVESGPGLRLDGESDDDLLNLFSYDGNRRHRTQLPAVLPPEPAAESRPEAGTDVALAVKAETPSPMRGADSGGEGPSADAARTEGQGQGCHELRQETAILRLGGEPVAVTVHPDQRPAWMAPGKPWTAPASYPLDGCHTSPHRDPASFELARWMEAVEPDRPSRTRQVKEATVQPAVCRVESAPSESDRARPTGEGIATPTSTPKTQAHPETRPLVTHFPPRPGSRDEAVDILRLGLRRRTSVARESGRRSGSFRWRRMLASAALSGSLGCAAMVLIRWIIR